MAGIPGKKKNEKVNEKECHVYMKVSKNKHKHYHHKQKERKAHDYVNDWESHWERIKSNFTKVIKENNF